MMMALVKTIITTVVALMSLNKIYKLSTIFRNWVCWVIFHTKMPHITKIEKWQATEKNSKEELILPFWDFDGINGYNL